MARAARCGFYAGSISALLFLGWPYSSLAAEPVQAFQPVPAASPEALPSTGPTSVAELEAFLDGVIGEQLMSKHDAGATVSVVKDGRLFFSKGYGYADTRGRIPVDPEKTLFWIGSISKLFTWTAIMQLVDQHRLELDADVNQYLKDFKIPATYAKPITVRNLLTHTTGLEEGFLGYMYSATEAQRPSPAQSLARHMPARVHPAAVDFNTGEICAYSNWGASLAGHIVATQSGLGFDDYMREHIFAPLGMNNSTFRQPLPEALAKQVSSGYVFEDGGFEPKTLVLDNFAPAGSMASTANDMAKFMIAHLQNGQLDDRSILSTQTAQLMHERALSPDPHLNGMGLGFFEHWLNGRRTIGHGGNGPQFTALMMLIPDANVGLFVSYNTANAAGADDELQRAFMDHYFPASLPDIKAPPDALKRNERFAGSYMNLRRSYTKIEKLIAGISMTSVEARADGSLGFDNARWIEVGEGVFRRVDTGDMIAFKGGTADRARYLFQGFAAEPLERAAWYESLTLHVLILVAASILFLTMIVSAIRHRRADRGRPLAMRWARPVLALTGGLLMACVVGIAVTVASLNDTVTTLLTQVPSGIYLSLTFALLAIPALAIAAACLSLAWRKSDWTLTARVHFVATAFAALAFLWVLNYWNVLGYRFG